MVADRRATAPPTRNTIKKGAVAIRDCRLWHRGMPSEGAKPRHMVALVYTAAGLHPLAERPTLVGGGRKYGSFNPETLVFSETCRDVFESAPPNPLVERPVVFVPEELVDHSGNTPTESAVGAASAVKRVKAPGAFWMPTEPVPLHGEGVRKDLPEWVQRVAEGKSIRGGPDVGVATDALPAQAQVQSAKM